jgi:hypothetical protein
VRLGNLSSVRGTRQLRSDPTSSAGAVLLEPGRDLTLRLAHAG